MIRIDVSDITRNLNIEDDLNDKSSKDEAKKIGLDLAAGLMQRTPVDTGRARQGWTLDDTGNEIVVENLVPYIGKLNDGHSGQAPAGFVEDEIDRVTRSK